MTHSLNDAQTSPAFKPLSQDAPTDEQMGSYAESFEFAFSRPDVLNIAVSGPESANKGALLNGWKATHDPERWLTVAVPHFFKESSRVTIGDAEDAIVNQLVCQMDIAKSPKSRFRNMMKRDRTLDAVVGVVFAAFVALGIFLGWAFNLLPSQRPPMPLLAIAFVAWIACIGFSVFQIARTDAIGRLFARFKRKGSDIELATGPNDSRIERYMGEIAYLLNTNDYDNVVFEDLDTYRKLPVFERLRALNALANAQRAGRRAPLRFMYLVGDGVFEDPHERAKFFDYIIPVIPLADSEGIFEQFKDALDDLGIAVSDEFLGELSAYIDDPSILRDIANEAHQYKVELFDGENATPGDAERLVTLIAYKALFPRDFELLQNEKGYLLSLLKSRTAIIAELRSRNAAAARELEAELAQAHEQADEARAEGVIAQLEALERDDVECSRKSLAQLLADLDDAKRIFANPPARDGLDERYLESVVESPNFAFLEFAVSSGWIDGTYERFISNFYAQSTTGDDRELIGTIAQNMPVRADRAVDNPFSVVSHLDVDAFALESARVYALLTHLLAYGPAEKLEALLRGINHDDDITWLLAYTESREASGAVYLAMQRALDKPIERILADGDLSIERRRRFCHRLLANGTSALADEGVRAAVRDFAHADPAFLHVECVGPMEIAESLDHIAYRPCELDCKGCDQELLQYVYAHDLYDPSAQPIDDLLATLLDTELALPRGFLATRVYSLTGTAVKEVVEDNAERFVSTLVEAAPSKLVDAPEAVAWVLNLEGLSEEHALAYIEALGDEVTLDWLATVENHEYRSALLASGLVSNTPANILDYFSSAGNRLDGQLARFLEDNPFPADFTMATTEEHLGSESGFLKAVIECDELSDEKVDEITLAYRAQFNHFDIEDISESRIEMLVESGVIRTSEDNLNFVRKACPAAAKHFARTDTAAYLALVLAGVGGQASPCGFSRDEALAIFDMADVDEQSKIALLDGFAGPVRLSASYPDELNTAIAQKHFDAADLSAIDAIYEIGNRKLKRALAEAAAAHHGALAAGSVKLSMEMVADIAWRLRQDRAVMLGFITDQLTGRDPEPARLEVRTVFERAGLKEYVALMAGPSALIPDAPEDNALVDALAAIGMAGKQTGKTDDAGMRRINSKGYTRK